jgi:hypothetical protein
MGVKNKDRNLEPKVVIKPTEIHIHDEGYKGKHPDDLRYPHTDTFKNEAQGQEVVLKAYSKTKLEELRQLSDYYLFPLLNQWGLKLDTLAEKRSGGNKGGSRTLGACFEARIDPKTGEKRVAIILDRPDSKNPRVLYTLIHEVAHILEMNHGNGFKQVFGEMLEWAVSDDQTDYYANRKELLSFAKGDTYAPPIPPSGEWDDYAEPARSRPFGTVGEVSS